MGGQFYDTEVCKDTLTYYPIGQYIPGVPNDIGIISVLCGVLNIVMSLVTVMWIKSQEREAQAENGREEAVTSVIFPVFVKVLWASAIVNTYAGIVTAFVPMNAVGNNSFIIAAAYAIVWALQHAVLEGIAFLLMQKGCGKHAARRAGMMAGVWAAITFVIMLIIFDRGGELGDVLEICWDAIMIVFYCALWLAPQKKFFRRPAAILYARFWFGYRVVVLCTNILLFFPQTSNLGSCGYILATVLLFAVFQPLVCYWTLLQDSRWWQGLDIDQGRRYESNEDIRSPLVGSDFSLFSAQNLAESMDHMRVHGQVKMLNFACIKLDHRKYLGAGSFSKVYRGTYRGKECAIKLIYTVDLTADVIKRVAAEASILSSIRHSNIVHIYGVSVLPPSVCLILELCSFGSLSDIIRGYGFDWNTSHRAPLDLSRTDSLYLALGCAKGLAAVHAYDSTICHRDVKSFNFLVDFQFNVKIADLELGIANSEEAGHSIQNSISAQDGDQSGDLSGISNVDPELVAVEALLANWMAPEVLRNRKFQQASDIYSLGSVMWEIISGQLPFDGDSQVEIRQKILSGYRHPIPPYYKGSAIAALITRCWHEEPSRRPLGEEVVSELEHILSDQCYGLMGEVESAPNTTALRDFYEQHFRQSNASSVYSDGQHGHRPSISFTSIFSRFNPTTTVQGDRQQESTDRSSASHTSTESSVNDLSTPLIVGGGEMDTIAMAQRKHSHGGNRSSNERTKSDTDAERRKHRESKSYFSNNMYSLRMQAQMPRAALDAIGLVREEGYWRHLEAHGGAWAVVTVESPHLVLHATSSWYRMFDINPSTISYTRLESLVSLMGTYHSAYVAASGNAAAFSASNNYVNFTNMEDNESAVNEILTKLEGNQQAHGVASFHLPPNAEASRQVGHNMMCTLHAYPIYSPRAWAQMEMEAAAANEVPSSKKSFSLRQTFSNMTQSRASFASTSAAKPASYSEPLPIDGGASLTDSVTSSSNDMLSFSPTDYMRSSLLAEGEAKGNYSPSIKPRLLGGSFSLRSNFSRSSKHLEAVTPLYFAVLFNEMGEQAPPLKPSPNSIGGSGHAGTRSRGNSTSSNGDSGGAKEATPFFPQFRSFITQPRGSDKGRTDGDALLGDRSVSMA